VSAARWEAAELGHDDVDTLFARSQAYWFGGLPDKAIPLLERILGVRTPQWKGHFFLVLADVRAGTYRDALKAGETYNIKFGERSRN